MEQTKQLSLREAILININIMLGAGIFINTVILSKITGALGGFMYVANGILVLPLILSMASLMHIHPRGGFFTFGAQELGNFFGFLSAWSYFIGKLASGALMMHTALLLCQTIIPALTTIPILYLDCGLLVFFTALNLLHMRVSMALQTSAFIIKLIPIFFAILSGAFLYTTGHSSQSFVLPETFTSLINAMPLVLFTALGFEATLSLSSKIENPDINGPRAIIIAFTAVIALLFGFQTLFYLALGTKLATFSTYLEAFPALIAKLTKSKIIIHFASSFFHCAIAASALGGAYSILFSTHWNLNTIARNNQIAGAGFLSQVNEYGMPTIGILLQAIVCLLYFFTTQGNQIPLQLTASFGCTIAYTISVLALVAAQWKQKMGLSSLIGLCALLNCGIFLASGLYSLFATTTSSLALFASMLLVGIILHVIKRP